MPQKPKMLKTAAFGAGCFWGVEETFRTTKGVKKTEVGYMGGNFKSPTYEDVCTDKTGHVEAVKVEYDPKQVSYKELLDVFWNCHDPTTKDRQGWDIGTQYRSVIFYYDKEQENTAKKSKEGLEKSGKFKKPVATEIVPATEFYRAEEYHQKYLMKEGAKVCH